MKSSQFQEFYTQFIICHPQHTNVFMLLKSDLFQLQLYMSTSIHFYLSWQPMKIQKYHKIYDFYMMTSQSYYIKSIESQRISYIDFYSFPIFYLFNTNHLYNHTTYQKRRTKFTELKTHYFYFKYIVIIKSMNRIIKMEEEEYPLSSPEYDHAFFNHCLTTFYDHDSNDEIIQAKCSAQQVLCHLERSIDLCDTPLSEIMELVTCNSCFKGVDLDLVRLKVLKQKNLLKRFRAKNRKLNAKQRKNILQMTVIHCDKQEEQHKKQRNRISAQISRDRKKQKVKELEELNRKLQDECQQKQIQNQILKKQVQASRNKGSNMLGELFKNKITKMFILLGIIFLFSIIKDLFSSNQSNSLPLATIAQSKAETIDLRRQSFSDDSEKEKKIIFQAIEDPLSELIEEKDILAKIKDKVRFGLRNWGNNKWLLPSSLKQQLQEVKHFAIN